MFGKKYKLIILIHGDEVCWIEYEAAANQRRFFQLPLERVFNDAPASLQLPDWIKGGPILCVIPDHWFGCETYPFRSKKPSLIEPFLERKLSTAYAAMKEIRHFFNYRHSTANSDGELFVTYFQEADCYRLYDALCNLHHPPQRITAPAFLWEERLQLSDHEFNLLGSLLIHMTGRQCQLYFYFKGQYQFSRSVQVSDAYDDLDALIYEINQSLYMFSQKAKSELDRIYLVCDAPQCRIKLSEGLGREIIDLPALSVPWPDTIKIPGLEPLDGLLQPSQLTSAASFFSVIHRRIKKALEWRPVQLAGIISGLFLLLGLTAENMVLGRMLENSRTENLSIQQVQQENNSAVALAEYAAMLDQVLDRAAQSALVEKVYRIPKGFPARMQLKKLDLALTSPATLKLAAIIQARDEQELTLVLAQLIARMKATFQGLDSFGFDDIEIGLEQLGDRTPNRYQINFQLELS